MKLAKILIAVAMLAATAAPASAQQVPLLTGVKLSDRSGVGTRPCGATQACLWRNGLTLTWSKSDGTDLALGGGGGSTGNFSFSGPSMDLSSGSTMYLGSSTGTLGNTTTLVLGPNNTTAVLLAGNNSGTGFTKTFNRVFLEATAASSGTTLVNSPIATWRPHYWNGSVDTLYPIDVTGVMDATTPTAHLGFQFNGVELYQLRSSGTFNLKANGSIGQIAQAASGTTALTVNCNVVDNASSVCFAEKNTTTSTAAILHAWENSAGTIEGQIELDTILAGSFVFRQPSTTYMGFFDSGNNGFKVQSGITYFRAGGADNWQVTSGDLSPVSAGFANLGVTNHIATVKSRHFSGGGTAPTKAAGACIGGTQTVTLDANASDAAGTITMTGTATGTASSTCATVTFNTAYATAPHCQIAPANAAAAALSGAASLYVDSASTTTSVFVIKSGATALVAGTYLYTYDCMQ